MNTTSAFSARGGSGLSGYVFFYFCLIIGCIVVFKSIYPGICQALSVNAPF